VGLYVAKNDYLCLPMLLLELFFTLAKGILIGILVSAPMGAMSIRWLSAGCRGLMLEVRQRLQEQVPA